MNLHTTRLQLRQVTADDVRETHALHSLPDMDRYNTLGIPENIAQTERLVGDWISNQNAEPRMLYVFCLTLAGTQEFVGLIGLQMGKPGYETAEVWYKIHPKHWNKGYATEALSRMISFGFCDLRLHRIEAGCAVENVASVAVLEKAGMQREGRKRKLLPLRGAWKDNYFYAMLEEDFFAK